MVVQMVSQQTFMNQETLQQIYNLEMKKQNWQGEI
jgi:hypothetical protein